MKQQRKIVVTTLVTVSLLSVTIGCRRFTSKPEPAQLPATAYPIIVPAATKNKNLSPLPDHVTATAKVRHCLNSLCETGASEPALAETDTLVAQLNVTSQSYAQSLAAILKWVLAYRDNASPVTATAPRFPHIPSELIYRAAAACDARGRRQSDEIVLSFAGDCTFGTVNGDDSEIRFPALYRRSGRLDYPFALVRPYFLNDDLTIVNFECTLTNATQTADKEWKFKGSAKYASIFPASSVEVAGLSNNHSFDYRKTGFTDTVSNFAKTQVPVFYQNTPFITKLHGVETVIIGDCTVVGENTTLVDGVPERVIAQIKRYKRPDNIVVVVMHWGSELDTVPRPLQQMLGRKFIDAGADAVVGHHPHVVQGIELYRGKYIAYSLGNFAFGGNSLARYPETFVLRLRFHREKGKIGTMMASIVPCRVTSTQSKNDSGTLHNNYQPEPVFGKAADQTVGLILERSAQLEYGVKRVKYLRLR